MIEVNLLPGGKKGARKGPQFSLSGLTGGLKGLDYWVGGTIAAAVLFVVAVTYLFLSTSGTQEDLALQVEEAVSDSARYADIIARTEMLQGRRDSIAQRVNVIQEIDRDRYLWPHIMDEIARALPQYTWLETMIQTGIGEGPQISLTGKAGNLTAVTLFAQALEASAFIQNVEIINTVQDIATDAAGRNRAVQSFELAAEYEYPPPELIETVPLFGGAEAEGPSADPSAQPEGEPGI